MVGLILILVLFKDTCVAGRLYEVRFIRQVTPLVLAEVDFCICSVSFCDLTLFVG